MRRAAARGGFSLLEILVALLILTICVSSILALYAVGAASHQRGLENAAAGWVAHQVAAELQGGTPASVTDRPGAGYGGRFRYDVALRPTGREEVVRAVVTVRWTAEGRPREHVFETLLLRPRAR